MLLSNFYVSSEIIASMQAMLGCGSHSENSLSDNITTIIFNSLS